MPGGLTLLAGSDASIPTPATGKVTIYFSTNSGLPSYKDDAGVVHSLIGTTGAIGPTGPVILPDENEEDSIISAPVTITGAGTGDVTGPAASVDDEIPLYSGTSGKVIKRSSGTGLVKETSGVKSNAVAGVDYQAPTNFRPGGRLTLVSGTPVQSGATVSGGTIYYDTFWHNQVPVYDGTKSVPLSIAGDEISLILDATHHPIENVYDIFGISVAGVLTLVTGPAWINTATITVTIASPAVVSWASHGLYDGAPVIFTTTGALPTGITAGTTYYVGRGAAAGTFNIATSLANALAGTFINTSGSQSGVHTGTNHTTTRGTGAGTTEIQLKNGVWTNKNSITNAWNNNVDLGPISANQGTLLGSIYTTAAATTRMDPIPTVASGGTNNFLALDNAYNPVVMVCRCADSAADWTHNTTTFRMMNNSGSNRITWLTCLPNEYIDFDLNLQAQPSSAGNQAQTGIWVNIASGNPSCSWQQQRAVSMTCTHGRSPTGRASIGINYAQACEQSSSGTSTFGMGGGTIGALVLSIPL